jgi:hypothetical protein
MRAVIHLNSVDHFRRIGQPRRCLTETVLSGSKCAKLLRWSEEGHNMAVATAPIITLTPAEIDERRLAVENAIGTMRIEDLEPDEITQQILARYANGEIELSETNHLLDECSRTIA